PARAHIGHRGHASGAPAQGRSGGAGGRSARRKGVLGRRLGTGGRRGTGNGFRRAAAQRRGHHPFAGRHDSLYCPRSSRLLAQEPVASPMASDLKGIGMTSARTRERLIQRLRAEGIRDDLVLGAMRAVPRHLLIDEALASRAYEDTALPIGHGQTISQPYIVARMTEALRAGRALEKVLEIGTGSGYQTAVLARLAKQVYSVERVEPLLRRSRARLARLAVTNVRYRLGDGAAG